MASYTRQSTFSDGDLITAALFNDEYNQLVAAFDNATGHRHDGTVGEGPVISVLGDAGLATPLNKILIDTTNDHIEFWIDVSGTSTQQLYIADGAILPVTDNDIDLGSNSLQFKDLYINGTANIDTLAADSVDINGGNIDGTVIGATTAAAGTFTTIDASGNVVISGNLTVSGTTTSVNSNEVNIGDNIIVLNSDETGTPSQNAGIEIERGTATNKTFIWDESTDKWTLGSETLVAGTVEAALTGNVTGDVTGDLTGNVTGNVTGNLTGDVTGDVTGDLTGSVLTAAQTNITSLGTLTSLTISGDLTVDTSTLYVDSTNNRIGIGTTSPVESLHTTGNIRFGDTAPAEIYTNSSELRLGVDRNNDNVTSNITFYVNNSESARIDASGNVLIGTTTNAGSGGVSIGQNATIYARRTGGEIITLRRDSTDGALINFQKDGTATGSISTAAGVMTLDAPNGNKHYVSNSALFPSADNILDLGTSSQGYKDLHLSGTANFGSLSDGTITITGFVDEDNMSSNSATLVPTQQSVKAYVDSQVGTVDTLSEILANGNTTGGTNIAFGDNDKAIFGTGSDFLLFHDGSNSFIKDEGTGHLNITTNGTDIRLQKNTGEYMAKFISDGAVELYYDNAAKIATTSQGINVTGLIQAETIQLNASGSSNPQIQLNNNDFGTFDWRVNQADSGKYVVTVSGTGGAEMELSSDGSNYTNSILNVGGQRVLTQTAGINLNGDLGFNDGYKAQFGIDADLQIFHDGTNSHIRDQGTGDVLISASDKLIIRDTTDGAYIAVFDTDGAVSLNYGNSTKFETTSTGIDVTGTATMDGLTVEGLSNATATTAFSTTANSPNASLIIANSAATTGNGNYKGALGFAKAGTSSQIRSAIVGKQTANSNNVQGLAFLVHPNSVAGTLTEALLIKANNDIAFYDDTGSTQGLFWDASAERLGIGTTSPDLPLTVESSLDYLANFKSTDTTAGILLTDSNAQCRVTNTNGNLCLSADINNEVANSSIRFLVDTTSNNGTDAAMVVRSTGLGIGIAAPYSGSKLHIRGTDGASGASTNIAANEVFIENNGNVGITLGTPNTGTGYYAFADSDIALRAGIFYDHSTDDMGFRVASSTAMTIDSNQNIGIGTTSISEKLVVNGNIQAGGNSPEIIINDNDATPTPLIRFRESGTTAAIIKTDSQNLIFTAGGGTERARLSSTGTLNVIGDANNGVKITSTTPYLFFNDTDSAHGYDSSISQSGTTLFVGGATPAQGIVFRNKASFGESARITTNGNFYVGTTSGQTSNSDITTKAAVSGDVYLNGVRFNTNTTEATNTAPSHKLWQDSTDLYIGSTLIETGATSDIRLKENIKNIPNAIEKVKLLNGVTFNYKKKPDVKEAGFIAQDVQKALPEAVYTAYEDNEEVLALRYNRITSVLVEAIKEQQEQIESLKSEIANLKGE